MTNKNLVLYHANCTDGFLSSFLLYLYFKEIGEVDITEFIAVNYNQPIPDVKDKKVFIVDFSYSKEVLDKASLEATHILMLDHHLTAAQQWGGYKSFTHQFEGGCEKHLVLEEHKSGAGLTYEWIMSHPEIRLQKQSVFYYWDDDRIPTVVKAVQDRDLWLFNLDNTKEISEALNILPRTFKAWEEFIIDIPVSEFNEKIKAARYYLEVKEKLAQDYAAKYQMINFLGYDIPIVNCPANFASRVCEIIYKDYPFSISYCLSLTEIFISFRSESKTGIDVSEIAKKFNGGGHRNSSGAKLSTNLIHPFLNGKIESIVAALND